MQHSMDSAFLSRNSCSAASPKASGTCWPCPLAAHASPCTSSLLGALPGVNVRSVVRTSRAVSRYWSGMFIHCEVFHCQSVGRLSYPHDINPRFRVSVRNKQLLASTFHCRSLSAGALSWPPTPCSIPVHNSCLENPEFPGATQN
jgi:hypothetical protein